MRSSNNRRPVPWRILSAVVFVFSSLAAGGITYLVENGRENASPAITSDTSWREPYRLLNSFWRLPVPEKSVPISVPSGRATMLLGEINCLYLAESALDQGNPTAAANILQPIDSRFPFINRKKNELWLRYLSITKKYRQYVEFSREKRLQGGELLLLTIEALVQSKRLDDAFRLFKGNFRQGKKLAFFKPAMPASLLRSFLRRLDADSWHAKFSWLLSRNEYREFLLESRQARFPQLVQIFRADFNYRNKRYQEARTLLAGITQSELLAYRDKLLLKIDLRSDKVSDVRSRVARFRDQGGMYNEILFDTASILLLREDYQSSLFHFAEFLRASTQKNADYWKAVWIMAWIHYRNGQQRMALKLFDRGSQANFLDYRLACQFWKSRLSGQPSPGLHDYPFSYYSIRLRGEESWRQRMPGRFLFLMSGPLSPLLRELLGNLRILAANGQFDSCFSLIHWGIQCPEMTRVDINLLKLLESILYVKQNRYDMAFDRFRANFKSYPMVRLPDFLSPLFFPTRYVDQIKKYSRIHGVDPLLVMAVIRDESFFRADAVSPDGACGLMQLLVETAAREARQSNIRLKRSQLFEAETNIRFGVQYLKTLLDKYQNRIHLALAAYNAGDVVVDQWLKKFGPVADDVFIELIPYTESRNYVKNILRNYFYYRYYYLRQV